MAGIGVRGPLIAIGCSALIAAGGMLLVNALPTPSPTPSTAVSDEGLARVVVDNFLKAPATAQYGEINILERGPKGWMVAAVTVDAQNSFGALLRNHYYAVFRRKSADGVEWTKLRAVREISPFDTQAAIDALKEENGFGE